MRKLILFIFTLVTFAAFAQNQATPRLPVLANKIVYLDTVLLDSNYSRAQLLDNAQRWYKANYETNDNILTTDNSRDGELNGTGIIHDDAREKKVGSKDVFFTIDIIAMRGSYVYRVYDLAWMENGAKHAFSDMYYEELHPLSKPQWPQAYREAMLLNMSRKVDAMRQQLEKSMTARGK